MNLQSHSVSPAAQFMDHDIQLKPQGPGELPQAKVTAITLLNQESQKTGVPLPEVFQSHGYAWGGQNGMKNPNDLITPKDFSAAAIAAEAHISPLARLLDSVPNQDQATAKTGAQAEQGVTVKPSEVQVAPGGQPSVALPGAPDGAASGDRPKVDADPLGTFISKLDLTEKPAAAPGSAYVAPDKPTQPLYPKHKTEKLAVLPPVKKPAQIPPLVSGAQSASVAPKHSETPKRPTPAAPAGAQSASVAPKHSETPKRPTQAAPTTPVVLSQAPVVQTPVSKQITAGKVVDAVLDAGQTVLSVASNIGPALVNTSSNIVGGLYGLATLATGGGIDKAVANVNSVKLNLVGAVPMPEVMSKEIGKGTSAMAAAIDERTAPGTAAYLGQVAGDALAVLPAAAAAKSIASGVSAASKSSTLAVVKTPVAAANKTGATARTLANRNVTDIDFVMKPKAPKEAALVKRVPEQPATNSMVKRPPEHPDAGMAKSPPVQALSAPPKPGFTTPAKMAGACAGSIAFVGGLSLGRLDLPSPENLGMGCVAGMAISHAGNQFANTRIGVVVPRMIGWDAYLNTKDQLMGDGISVGSFAFNTAMSIAAPIVAVNVAGKAALNGKNFVLENGGTSLQAASAAAEHFVKTPLGTGATFGAYAGGLDFAKDLLARNPSTNYDPSSALGMPSP